MDQPERALNPLELADAIAKPRALYIIPVRDKSGQTAYVVYRRSPIKGAPGIRLGRRSNPEKLLRFVRSLTTEKETAT